MPIQEQHPDVGVGSRQLVMFAGGDPAVGARYLRAKGLQVEERGGFNYSIKRPEEAEWRVLDPEGFDLQDILDVSGDVLSLGGMIGGGVAGAPGVVTGAAGAAGGAAGAQGVRSAIGQLGGLTPTSEEVVGDIGEEAVMGAGAELGGRVVGKIAGKVAGKLRKAPEPPPPVGKPGVGPTGMREAIERLGPEERFTAEFSEKVPKGVSTELVTKTGEFQKLPPKSDAIYAWAKEQAEEVAGKGAWKGKSVRETTDDLYTRMIYGEIPKAGPGRVGPFVDVAKRESQLGEMNPALVRTVGSEISRVPTKMFGGDKVPMWGQTATPTLKQFLGDEAIPPQARKLLSTLIRMGPKSIEKNLPNLTDTIRIFAKERRIPLTTSQGWIRDISKELQTWSKNLLKPPQQLVRPLGEMTNVKVPTGSEVAFWKTLPETIEKLTLPDGTVLTLNAAQGKAVKAVAQSAATNNWTPKAKALLEKLVKGLRWPRNAVIRGIESMVHPKIAAFLRAHPGSSNVAAMVGGAAGVPGGGAAAVIAGADVAGRGMGILVNKIMKDSTGKALTSILTRAKTGAPEALKRAARAAGGGNQQLYKAIMWGALQKQDVQEFFQAEAGSRGVNAETGPRSRAGYQGA